MLNETLQDGWCRIGTPAIGAAYTYAYGTDWATGFQNPDNWPSKKAVIIPRGCNAIRGMFTVSDAAAKSLDVRIWLKEPNGPPKPLVIFSSGGTKAGVIAGTAPVALDPFLCNELTNYFYADSLILAEEGFIGDVDIYSTGTGGIAEFRCDVLGGSELLMEGLTGTATDCIGYFKTAY